MTTAARRIARGHNKACGGSLSGGVLVFDSGGGGGEWYSRSSYGFGDDAIVFGVRHRRVSAREVQEWLDARREDTARGGA